MVSACKALGMKPVCDHPGYCRNDGSALYIGQTGHLAYRPHRNSNNYLPVGLAAVRDKWDGLCSYTANANGNNALCNIPTNTHAWRNPAQYNPGFVCGKIRDFSATLVGKSGNPGDTYVFSKAWAVATVGKYSHLMIVACKALGMKPVCDNPRYCEHDGANSLYIGQTGHLALPTHRNSSYTPLGFEAVRGEWEGLCSYTATAVGAAAICNIPINTYSWRTAAQANPGFVCGLTRSITAKLAAKNGVPAMSYEFKKGSTLKTAGTYSARMLNTGGP